MANWHHTASRPHAGERPSLTQRNTPPVHPDASSAATSDCGSRKMIAGTRYRNTHVRPYTAIVGALRRLATEAVVMNAKVSHVMYVGFATTALAAGFATGRSAGTSIDAMQSLPCLEAV